MIENLVFFQERGTPPLRPPPRPQAKTCPPVSRVFKRRQELFAAQSVTFLDSTESSSLTGIPFLASQHYDSTNKASYFEQVKYLEFPGCNQLKIRAFQRVLHRGVTIGGTWGHVPHHFLVV